jgi:hypothetical protein
MTSQEPAPGYDPLLFVLGIQAHHSLSLFTYDSLSPRFVFFGFVVNGKEEHVVANKSWLIHLVGCDEKETTVTSS